MSLNNKQIEAINNFEKALRQLKKNKIRIAGMDQDLYYATEKIIKKYKSTQDNYYPNVAHAYTEQSKDNPTDNETGRFKSSRNVYDDSAGW